MNDNNLIPGAHALTVEEQSKGGQASGAARRRKRDMRAAMNELLSSDIGNTDIFNLTAAMGVDLENMTYQTAVLAAMIREAAFGNVKAFHEIKTLIGADNSEVEGLKLAKRKVKMAETRQGTSEEAPVDDGFIEALAGTAAQDWNDEIDDNDKKDAPV